MTRLFARPKTRRGAIVAIAAGIAAVAVVGFAVIYLVFLPTSSPKPFRLTTSNAGSPTTSANSSTAGSAAGPATGSATGAVGRWQIAAGSEAGYRVREQLAFLPAQSDAVGRTSSLTGTATIAQSHGGVTITEASFKVAVDTLKSDRSMRDEKIHTIGLESDRYPTATFTLSAPLTLPASVLSGNVAHLSARGALDIHGTSQRVTIPLELRLAGSTLQAAGSLRFPWSQFNMSAPSIGGFVTVTDKATLEFDLRLQRG
ncbi:MAG: polyisoprenoid-binding protein [Solirubrobacterales bacterium]|jgi:polyisoprenoid-binding protein YceI|nr:polyisoprenoid-binding protein [Solirubrobacterales bacterium]